MSVSILVIGSESFTDPSEIGPVLEHACQQFPGEAIILKTLGQGGAEAVAIQWAKANGVIVQPAKPFKNPYVAVNSAIKNSPDLIVLFGNSKLIDRAMEDVTRHELAHVWLAEAGAA